MTHKLYSSTTTITFNEKILFNGEKSGSQKLKVWEKLNFIICMAPNFVNPSENSI